jgi:hypothetical protein
VADHFAASAGKLSKAKRAERLIVFFVECRRGKPLQAFQNVSRDLDLPIEILSRFARNGRRHFDQYAAAKPFVDPFLVSEFGKEVREPLPKSGSVH